MKPRNKFERHVMEIQDKLPKISVYEKYAQSNGFKSYAMISRNRIYCMECNHKWGDGLKTWQHKMLKSTDCPSCKRKLKVLTQNETTSIDESYTMVLDRVNEFQVIRYIHTERFSSKKNKPTYYSREVVQRWINPKGKSTIIARTYGGLHGYGWLKNSEFSIKADHHKYTIYPQNVYPKRKIIPQLKRNGFKTSFYNISADELFTAILKEPKGETLLKAKQYKMLKGGIHGLNVDKYWSSIKIAIRNKYIIQDPTTWRDYIDLLSYFNKDVHSHKYVCPEDLDKEHNRLSKKKSIILKAERLAKKKADAKKLEATYKKSKKKFFNLVFEKKELRIEVMTNIQQFIEESELLKHCLFNNSYYQKNNSLILSARYKGKIVESIEVNLERMEVEQARGYNNEPSIHNKKIVKLVQENLKAIQKIHNKNKAA